MGRQKEEHEAHLSILICGYVDSAKSPNTGRFFFALGGLPERQWEKLKAEAASLGKGSIAPCFLHGPSEGGA